MRFTEINSGYGHNKDKESYIKDNSGKYGLGQKYNLALVRTHDLQLDHDGAFHVTEMPTVATWTSVTSLPNYTNLD